MKTVKEATTNNQQPRKEEKKAMKTTQKEIRNMVNAGIATDITYFQFSDIEQLRKAEK